MTFFAYPRLGDAEALVLLARVKDLASKNPRDITSLVACSHPSAHPVPTGARIASELQIRDVRRLVLSCLERWSTGQPVPAKETIEFDRALGLALHEHLQILPADAAHRNTWNFLSAVVFPDMAWARFPDLHEDRFLGSDRNALRRAWYRREVLGQLLDHAARPLGEDELVGLLERTALARNRRLVRSLATELLAYEGRVPRSQFARDLYKRATHLTGPLLLDVLTDEDLQTLVQSLITGEPWPFLRQGDEESSRLASGARHKADLVFPLDEQEVAHPRSSGDLVRQFHREMEGIFARTLTETGYRASKFFSMVNDLGGLETARRLVGAPNPSEGFTVLWEMNRLDLTAEALILQPPYRGLFTPDLLETASKRLQDYGYEHVES